MKLLLMIFTLFLTTSFSAYAQTIDLPAEDAYAAAIEQILDMDGIPSFRDAELLLIKTDPIPMKLNSAQVDCGSMFGIPYIKDKRTKTAVAYKIRIKKAEDNTSDIDVDITIDGYMDVNENAPFFVDKTRDKSKTLTCKSKGILEEDFVADLIKE